MKLAKRLGYKLIVVMCIIFTFCTFIASTPVEASKVNKTDFYYSGTTKGSYTVNKSFIDKLIESLGDILDYLLGLLTMGVRMVFIGWTALFECCLTWLFQGATGEKIEVDSVSSAQMFGTDDWITVDAIFFNHIPLLDINFFNFEGIKGYDATGTEIQGEEQEHNAPQIIYTEENDEIVGNVQTNIVQGEKKDFKSETEEENESLVLVLKKAIAGWYYTLRLISIMVMLVILMYIGVQLAIKSSASDKAVYKRMLTDWVVGMILVFFIHYIMLFIVNLNEVLVDAIAQLRTGTTPLAVYEYGLEERATKPITNEELEFTLYDEVKTRAYDLKMTVGMSGMVMYMVLVYYAWKFSFIYLKRYLTVAVLTIMAPLVAVTYAYNKVRTGKATIFSKWLKEYFFIVILQSIHALIYVVFVQTALAMSLNSISGIILVFVLLNFMSKAEGLFRKIFNVQGNLTNDIAAGGGIRDLVGTFKGAMATMAVGKVAKNYTKGVAKIVTKPLAKTGEIALGAGMKHRAKRLDEKAKKYAEEHKDDKHNNDKINDYSDLKKALRNKRTNAIKIGRVLKGLKDGTINLEDLEELEEEINSLEVNQPLYDENGSFIGLVDNKYIDKKKSELSDLKTIANLNDEDKTYWMDEYNKLLNRKGNLKRVRMYVGDKWADIMDPGRYVKTIEDKDGNKTYKKIESEYEYGSVHFKHMNLGFGKKTDSIGKRFRNQLKFSNLANLNKEEKETLKAQAEFLKHEILGFFGIAAGLPLLVAEPAAGMGALAIGINSASKVLSGTGKRKEKDLKLYKMDSGGKYTFKRFEGKSEHTIAEGAKAAARAQVQEIANAKAVQEASMKARMEAKHPKLALSCKVAANTGKAAQFVTIGTLGMIGGVPGIVAAAGAAGSVKLTGSILNRLGDNAWTRFQATARAAAKADAEAFEKDEKRAGTSDYLNALAENYLELEHQEYKRDGEKHAEQFAQEYAVILTAMQEKIEQKTDAELLRDTGYEDEIKTETTPDGKTKLSLDSENKLIDNALIEYAQKSGIMDVTKINVEDKKSQIENILKTDLITRGIIGRDESVEVVVTDLTERIKDRQSKFKENNNGREAVEAKIAGDAIISLMQEKNITDPTQISDEDALERFNVEYNKTIQNMAQSSAKTNNAVEQLNALKGDGSQSPRAMELEEAQARVTTVIQSRKSSFSDKAKKKIDDSVAKTMKETLKKKTELDLDKKILEKEEELTSEGAQNVLDILSNESGGIDSSNDGSVEVTNTEDILKMLQLQTQLYQDKKKMAFVEQKKKERVQSSYQQITGDGLRSTIDDVHDGSKRVVASNMEISEILKRKKQELNV